MTGFCCHGNHAMMGGRGSKPQTAGGRTQDVAEKKPKKRRAPPPPTELSGSGHRQDMGMQLSTGTDNHDNVVHLHIQVRGE